ncbi:MULTISPECIES: hypothetical protein [Cupriavidus]
MERVREPAHARLDGQAGERHGGTRGGWAGEWAGEWASAWRGPAGAAAALAGLSLALGTDARWLQLAGVFLTTLGVHFWVMSRQQR